MFKGNNRNTRKKCEICSALITGVFVINFEDISSFIFLISVVDFEQANVSSEALFLFSSEKKVFLKTGKNDQRDYH